MRNVSDKVVDKIEIFNLISNKVFPENCAFYEIMWKNMVDPNTKHTTNIRVTRRMRFACYLTKATNTHSECVALTASAR